MPDTTHALIIDNDEDSIFVLQNLLHKLEVKTTAIQTSQDMLAEITDIPVPDIVFLDLNMPVLNGYQLLIELLNIDDYISIPIVAYTMHTDQLNNAYEAGFHSFLGKPINRHTFADKLDLIFDGEHIWEVS